MESLAQELIDAIIGCLPSSDMRSCSLVAKRWRRTSQQCTFAHVMFRSERRVVLWYTNIPQDPDGIPSYVQTSSFFGIEWQDPTLFGRVVKCFSNLKSLSFIDGPIPEPGVLDGSVPFGEFSQQITYLALHAVTCSTTTMMSLILSLPNLQDLSLIETETGEDETAISLGESRSKVLGLLQLQDVRASVVTAITQCSFTSRKMYMSGLSEVDMARLLAPSSQTLAILELGDWFLVGDRTAQRPTIRIPRLPALEALVVEASRTHISDRLADILFSIHSSPKLSSIAFTFSRAISRRQFPAYDAWRSIDDWLARLARMRTKSNGLKVELRPVEAWPEAEGFLCLFEEAGGEVRTRLRNRCL